MIADILYALCALVALFIPMGFAWAVVRWMNKRHLHGDAFGGSAPAKLHPSRHAKPRHPRRRAHSVADTLERPHSSGD